jgi:hypothetical protein
MLIIVAKKAPAGRLLMLGTQALKLAGIKELKKRNFL